MATHMDTYWEHVAEPLDMKEKWRGIWNGRASVGNVRKRDDMQHFEWVIIPCEQIGHATGTLTASTEPFDSELTAENSLLDTVSRNA